VSAVELTSEQVLTLQKQRACTAAEHAHADRAAKSVRHQPDAVRSLLRRAAVVPRPGKRIRLVLEAADAFAAPFSRVAACRRGCAHCCHQAVPITGAEARLLSQATGRPLASPENAMPVRALIEETPQQAELRIAARPPARPGPCPFLVDDECSAYAQRPLTCRTHISLASSDLLCRVVPGHPVGVPYADATLVRALGLAILEHESIADIREWFPSPPETP
jgi:Fe-S-cluster containining protein